MENKADSSTRGCRCTCVPINIHVRILYFWTFVLSILFGSGVWYLYQEIRYLKSGLEDKLSWTDIGDLRVYPKPPDEVYSQLKEYDVKGRNRFIEQGEEYIFSVFDWVGGDPKSDVEPPFREESVTSWQRRKRHALLEGSGSDGNPDNWLWMSGYSRVPMAAIESYCKASKEYCAVQGPTGLPGVSGTKGDKGDTGPSGLTGQKGVAGDKGTSDPELVAENRRQSEHLRGPPGQKGDRGLPGLTGPKGERGAVGPPGPVGPRGLPGKRGVNGMDGVPGKRGDVGPKGMRGLLGFPGKKGLPGYNDVCCVTL
ncbi:collagen alpha-1(II) chain-like [Gigantopelta aegis]|uniref:collagen alpha-1(II) chain-like n=1 Tax=Gigantopelta aegis TaxID=1735272 RepID=UPI001B88AE64|nr:collagen alpha-1(II) chain-like [Gigantopelta aegis]